MLCVSLHLLLMGNPSISPSKIKRLGQMEPRNRFKKKKYPNPKVVIIWAEIPPSPQTAHLFPISSFFNNPLFYYSLCLHKNGKSSGKASVSGRPPLISLAYRKKYIITEIKAYVLHAVNNLKEKKIYSNIPISQTSHIK